MKNIIINNMIKTISKYYNYDKDKLDEIRYGLEAIYLSIFKAILFCIISIVFNTVKELFLFLLTFGLLRLNGFGVHAKKSIHCWISSSIFFIGFPILIKYIEIDKLSCILLSIPLIILILKYAPADTEKRPLINKKKRIIFKINTFLISLIYFAIMISSLNNQTITLLFLSIFLEAILISPISYRVLGMKYSNYLRYKENN